MKVDILMATYNGAKYIESQILSLLAQTFKDWRLIIHDDDSSDNTVDVVRKYVELDSRIQLITDGEKCGGAAANFMHLLKFAKADYIIFCDQDDIWLENKLEVFVSGFCSKKSNDKPQAFFASGYLYDDNKGISGEIPSLKIAKLKDLLFVNAGLQGCSLMFDREILEIVRQYNGFAAMHDHILTLAVICFGKLNYIDDKLMLYRQQHDGKVTANIETKYYKKIYNSLFNKFPVVDKAHYQSTKSFYLFYKEKLDNSQRKLFEQYFQFYETNSVFKRLRLIIQNRFAINESVLSLCVKVLLRPVKN